MMKRMSMSMALRCETATCKRCRCRCGGAYHGSLRGKDEAFFEALPEDDPHHALTKESLKIQQRRNKRRQHKMPFMDERR